jgi:hypothetical protein
MKTLADWLRDGDPVGHDPGLSDDESAELRRRVVQAAGGRAAGRFGWREPLILVGALALLVLAAIVTDQRRIPSSPAAAASPAHRVRTDERRQLQFATPGGTRIIWTFDPDFNLKEPVR